VEEQGIAVEILDLVYYKGERIRGRTRYCRRNLRPRTSMLAQVLQIFFGKEHLVKKSADWGAAVAQR
jgi:hypothetical protein